MEYEQLKRCYKTVLRQRDEHHDELVDAHQRIEELEALLFRASEQIYDQPELEQEIQNALD
jgi:predicted  nucleic acid-binding Zn-ribbon protein|tara:strand:+ start:1155 stop:1337 length:183 start_codon:yes stop_codon:yes gene_type:complete